MRQLNKGKQRKTKVYKGKQRKTKSRCVEEYEKFENI